MLVDLHLGADGGGNVEQNGKRDVGVLLVFHHAAGELENIVEYFIINVLHESGVGGESEDGIYEQCEQLRMLRRLDLLYYLRNEIDFLFLDGLAGETAGN